MKKSLIPLLVFALTPLFAAEGDVLLFDEFRDPQESAKNYFSYIRKLPAGDQLYFDKNSAAIADGALQVNNTRLFSVIKNLRNCEVEFEFRMVKDREENGKHHGFVGFELRPLLVPPETNDKEAAARERSFRVFCQIGRPMPLHDVRASSDDARRTAGVSGMNQSKMPVMEAGRWYKMQLVCRGQDVTVRLDGVEIGTVKHTGPKDSFNPEGRVAFWVHAGSAEFRNLLIRDLGETAN